ncbi:MAG: hypothetical protein E7195_06165 [Peptococcaceae bacterium]|nr:hypothetical protein [Peptococcaceae bacterium]
MKRKEKNAFGLGATTVEHHINSGVYYYLYLSKPNWSELINRNGLPLSLPPVWQHGSTTQLRPRLTDHNKHAEILTTSQLKRSVIQKYIRENNLVRSTDYYFDTYVLDFTDLFFFFELSNRCNKWNAVGYKEALEAVMKHNISEWFITDGKPVTDRFDNIWGNVWGNDLTAFSIEQVKKPRKKTAEKADKVLHFINRLLEDENTSYVVTDALKVLTADEALEQARERYNRRKESVDKNKVNKYLPLY